MTLIVLKCNNATVLRDRGLIQAKTIARISLVFIIARVTYANWLLNGPMEIYGNKAGLTARHRHCHDARG